MSGPHPAVAATRLAVRTALLGWAADEGHRLTRRKGHRLHGAADPARPLSSAPPYLDADAPLVLAACSGGADSLALAAALAFEAPRLGLRAGAVIVDHALQPGSAGVAERAAAQCEGLRLAPVLVRRVTVTDHALGPEAAARNARYAAFEHATAESGGTAVLLAHTRSDQAEQVLLGLARGSGARSLAGMPARRGPYLRPFLDLPASTTRQACAALELTPWEDPHNADERYLRVRARRLIGEMEDALGPGVVAGLARSAYLLREDADTLDALAQTEADRFGPPPWPVTELAAVLPAVRARVWRLLATHAGADAGALTATHVDALDALVTRWRGQRGVHLPGGIVLTREDGRITRRPQAPRVD